MHDTQAKVPPTNAPTDTQSVMLAANEPGLVMQMPSVGRVVHYYENGEGPFAATITKVGKSTYCSLAVLKPKQTSLYVVDLCAHQKVALSDWPYWVWPPRV